MRLIGWPGLGAHLNAFGDGCLHVLTDRAAERDQQRARIAALTKAGWSAARVARAVGCDECTVRRVRKGQWPRQPSIAAQLSNLRSDPELVSIHSVL